MVLEAKPDMVLFIFTKAILEDTPIDVYNFGKIRRDFTYIDDTVESVVRLVEKVPHPNPEWNGKDPDPATSLAPYRFTTSAPTAPPDRRVDYHLEEKLGKKAKRHLLPCRPEIFQATFADVTDLEGDGGYRPRTSLKEGIGRFVDWYLDYYNHNAVACPGGDIATDFRLDLDRCRPPPGRMIKML
jgi:UDP-glucuronate 4-epimerase